MSWIADAVGYYFEAGGFVMPPLVLGTVLLWYALGYRYSVMRGDYVRTPEKATAVIQARTIALNWQKKNPGNLRHHLEEEFYHLKRQIGRFSGLVQSIVIVSPLLGLLGTVVGMIETFDSLGDMTLFSQSGGISGGIAQALISTQMGLAVAIPGLVFGRLLNNKQKIIESRIEQIKDEACALPQVGGKQ